MERLVSQVGQDSTEKSQATSKWFVRCRANTFKSDGDIELARVDWQNHSGHETKVIREDDIIKFVFDINKPI